MISRSGFSAEICSINGIEVCFSDKIEVVGERRLLRFGRQDAGCPHLDLAFGFFSRNIKHSQPVRHLQGHLQHQRGLADAGVAAHQHDRAGHDPPAQHAGKLTDRDGDAVLRLSANIGEPPRRRSSAQATGGVLPSAGLIGNDLLDHAVERTTLGAFTHVTGGNASTLLADVTSMGFWHAYIIPFGGYWFVIDPPKQQAGKKCGYGAQLPPEAILQVINAALFLGKCSTLFCRQVEFFQQRDLFRDQEKPALKIWN